MFSSAKSLELIGDSFRGTRPRRPRTATWGVGNLFRAIKGSVLTIATLVVLQTVYFNRPDVLWHACYMNPAPTLSCGCKINRFSLAHVWSQPGCSLMMLHLAGISDILLRCAAKSRGIVHNLYFLLAPTFPKGQPPWNGLTVRPLPYGDRSQ